MDLLTAMLIIALPSLLVRIFILHPRLPFTSKKALLSPLMFLIGIALDIFVAVQILVFYEMIASILPVIAKGVLVTLAFVYQAIVIFDGFLFRKMEIRLEIGYLRFAKNLKTFKDSGKERGFYHFLPVLAAALLLQIGGAFLIPSSLPEGMAMPLACLGVLVLGALFWLPSKYQYALFPICLIHQQWLLLKLLRRFQRGEEALKNTQVFQSENEIFHTPTQSYPLLKWTKGYEGEKLFEIDMSEKPNVVLVFLESFRAKDVGCLGGTKGLTPHFDALAKEGVLFSQFYCNSVRTSRCALSSLFGLPSDVDGSGVANKVKTPYVSLADIMKTKGYHSAYLHNGALKFENQAEFFKHHGYDTILGRDQIVAHCEEVAETSWGVHDEYMMRYALHWMKERERESDPFFLTIFTVSNHHPWKLPPELDKGLSLSREHTYERYQKTFSYTDENLGALIEGVKGLNLKRPTLFVILGDHGFPMGEREGNYNLQKGLYEEQMRVPLLLYSDRLIPKPVQIDTPASQLDLMPTFIDLLGFEGLHHAMGSSLLRKKEGYVFFHNPYMYRFIGARKGRYKCIYLKTLEEAQLFDLENDPEELTDISEEHPDLVKEMVAHIKDYERGIQHCYDRKCIMPSKKEQEKLRLGELSS